MTAVCVVNHSEYYGYTNARDIMSVIQYTAIFIDKGGALIDDTPYNSVSC